MNSFPVSSWCTSRCDAFSREFPLLETKDLFCSTRVICSSDFCCVVAKSFCSWKRVTRSRAISVFGCSKGGEEEEEKIRRKERRKQNTSHHKKVSKCKLCALILPTRRSYAFFTGDYNSPIGFRVNKNKEPRQLKKERTNRKHFSQEKENCWVNCCFCSCCGRVFKPQRAVSTY